MGDYTLFIAIGSIVALLFITGAVLASRYKRCPSDQILVIYGKTGGSSANCIHGGGAFVWPIIQAYGFLDLKPMSINADLRNALSKQNIRVNVPSVFTIAISSDQEIMNTAAEKLFGLQKKEIEKLAEDILFGQLRLVIATMSIEEINSDRTKFLNNITENVDSELRKLGLKLINVNITDIRDESGYIDALGKDAASKAVNEALISVAKQEKIGQTGKSQADKERITEVALINKDRNISVADAEKEEAIGKALAQQDMRVRTSEANANAVDGENKAFIQMAESNSKRRSEEAKSEGLAYAAENVAKAEAEKKSFDAQRLSEVARAEKENASKTADILVPADIERKKFVIEAEAHAEAERTISKGKADGKLLEMNAQAEGLKDILTKQAEGFEKVVTAVGSADKAYQMLMIEKLPELMRIQVDAIKNIKIDKITVWDSGNGNGNGSSTSNFISNMIKSTPPLQEILGMSGMDLPTWAGTKSIETESDEEVDNDGKQLLKD